MDISAGQLIIWLIIGGLAGSLAGWITTRSKRGFGRISNLIIGLIGAVIGGFLFDLLEIDLGLGELTLTAEDLIAAFVGSLILIAVIRMIRSR